MNNITDICILCGIKEINSIIIQLKGKETYMSIIDDNEYSKYDQEIKMYDETDNEILNVVTEMKLDLSCPKQLDINVACVSMLRLAKILKLYQNWINNIQQKTNKSDIDTTTNVNILQLTNEEFCENIIQVANNIKGITEIQVEEMKTFLDDEIINIQIFCKIKRREFCEIVWKNTTIKLGTVSKLYRKLTNDLHMAAQTKQFGQFLLDSNAYIIDEDYHHILRYHVSNQFGNVLSRTTVFKYFTNVLDCNLQQCESHSRYLERDLRFKETTQYFTDKSDKVTGFEIDDKIWQMKQRYIQTTLDLIHVYFAHHHFPEIDNNNLDTKNVDKIEYKNYDASIEMMPLQNEKDNNLLSIKPNNKDKYVTDTSNTTQYGFGIDHSYPHLKPLFSCIKEELTKNKQHRISPDIFDDLLIKALKHHSIATNMYELKCIKFKEEYNIIRNTFIGIRHLLSILIYTDMSKFCTVFRQTYRKLNSTETEYEVQMRHCELYYYSKSLFEAVDLFGTEMDENMVVYHGLLMCFNLYLQKKGFQHLINCTGLNKVMNFELFTAYFNQPISTTMSVVTALQFTNGNGIYLTLKRGSNKDNDRLIPKYFDVSWLSQYPNENERLFYGENVFA
eukprot:236599_1